LYDDRYGYKARDLEVDLQGSTAAVKIMNIDPRRIERHIMKCAILTDLKTKLF
jgi:hypothetical protein